MTEVRNSQVLWTIPLLVAVCVFLSGCLEFKSIEQPVLPTFPGTFDGNGFAISNLTLAGDDHLGLIGTIEDGGQVQNLGVINAGITGAGDYIGIIVGANGGTVTNSYSTGSVVGRDSVGGLVGYNYTDDYVTRCYSIGTVVVLPMSAGSWG